MNTLRRTFAAAILTLAIAVSASAGQIDSPGAKPLSGTSPTTGSVAGEISSPGVSITTTVILTLVSWIR